MATQDLETINESGALTSIKFDLENRPALADNDVLTKLEILQLVGNNAVSGLSLSNSSSISEVGTSFNPSPITWVETGYPLGLELADTDGELVGQSVSGGSYSGSETYSHVDTTTVTWTLSGSNVDSITAVRYWVHSSYWGVNTSGSLPTEGQILEGTKLVVRTNAEINADIVTESNQFGWVAVHKAQSQAYTTWIVDGSALDTGAIGTGNFIELKGEVSVGGFLYRVYMFDQAKTFDNQLTLT